MFPPPPTNKRPHSPSPPNAIASSSTPKRPRPSTPTPPPSLNSWLGLPGPPPLPEPFVTSKPIYDKDSIFIAYAMPFPGTEKIGRGVVEGLIKRLPHDSLELPDVIAGRKGKKIRPSHNMWAYRALVLKPTHLGTSPDDYELAEDQYDDGEKWGGEKVLKVMKEEGAVDVLVVCCRWFGGTMIGPARFLHIQSTTLQSLTLLTHATTLLALRTDLLSLDSLILEYRLELDPSYVGKEMDYDGIEEVGRLERLVRAREGTVGVLVERVARMGAGEGGGTGGEGQGQGQVEGAGEGDGVKRVSDIEQEEEEQEKGTL